MQWHANFVHALLSFSWEEMHSYGLLLASQISEIRIVCEGVQDSGLQAA